MRISAAAALLTGLAIAASAGAEPPRTSLGTSPVMVQRAEPTARATPPAPMPDPAAIANARALRAQANLEALLQGRIYTSDLSPQDLQDVLDLERLARSSSGDSRSFAQQCIDEEVRRNGGRPTRLAWQVIRMKCQ